MVKYVVRTAKGFTVLTGILLVLSAVYFAFAFAFREYGPVITIVGITVNVMILVVCYAIGSVLEVEDVW